MFQKRRRFKDILEETMTAPTITSYDHFLHDLKARIRAARTRAALAVNLELVLLYWHIGRDILERQEREGWGAKVIVRLATDLRVEFPDMRGFSPRNLKYMRKFAESWNDEEFVQQTAAQIGQPSADQLPWFHIVNRSRSGCPVRVRRGLPSASAPESPCP